MALTDDQIRRYARHILLPEVGGRGQERLLAARVRAVDAGGGAAAALLYLAAAGVGTLVIADPGQVLPEDRWLYAVADRGRPRRQAAHERLQALNPDVRVLEDGEGLPLVVGGGDAIDELEQGARAAAHLIREIVARP